MARWKEHFQEVLNRDTPEAPPQEEEGEELTSQWHPQGKGNQDALKSGTHHGRDAESR